MSTPLVICDMLYCICQQNERGLCLLFILWHTASFSKNGIFAFRVNLAGALCPLLHWRGFQIFPGISKEFAGKDCIILFISYLRISVLIVMKSDQLHLPTGQLKPVAAAASHIVAALPYIPCLWVNGQVDRELGFSPCAPSIFCWCANCQEEFRKINQGFVIQTRAWVNKGG